MRWTIFPIASNSNFLERERESESRGSRGGSRPGGLRSKAALASAKSVLTKSKSTSGSAFGDGSPSRTLAVGPRLDGGRTGVRASPWSVGGLSLYHFRVRKNFAHPPSEDSGRSRILPSSPSG